jgi:hypothetical protein
MTGFFIYMNAFRVALKDVANFWGDVLRFKPEGMGIFAALVGIGLIMGTIPTVVMLSVWALTGLFFKAIVAGVVTILICVSIGMFLIALVDRWN